MRTEGEGQGEEDTRKKKGHKVKKGEILVKEGSTGDGRREAR